MPDAKDADLRPPDRPARDSTKVPPLTSAHHRHPPPVRLSHPPPLPLPTCNVQVKLVPSKDAPRRGKGGSLASRHAMLHSLVGERTPLVPATCGELPLPAYPPASSHLPVRHTPQVHIESMAVDLAWDIIARFGADPSYRLPRAFFDDFVAVRSWCLGWSGMSGGAGRWITCCSVAVTALPSPPAGSRGRVSALPAARGEARGGGLSLRCPARPRRPLGVCGGDGQQPGGAAGGGALHPRGAGPGRVATHDPKIPLKRRRRQRRPAAGAAAAGGGWDPWDILYLVCASCHVCPHA